jgi:hypothetical protein
MPLAELRDEFEGRLVDFLWSQWGQMGVPAHTNRRDEWAADPEALLLLTFEVGRGEPRLFDEMLDWLVINERLVSVQRLRNLAAGEDDRALVEAVLGWLGQNRRRPRLGARSAPQTEKDPQPFFRDTRLTVSEPDPAFLAQGFLKPRTEPRRVSVEPDIHLPINFAFRLRMLLGIGVRSEVIRVLVTDQAPWVNAQTLATSVGYSKRNVQEAVGALDASGALGSWEHGNENRFEASRERWTNFLELKELPRHVAWPQLLRTYSRILRWLQDPDNQDLSDYMFSSRTQTLVEGVERDLLFAGMQIGTGGSTQDLPSFGRFVRSLVLD